MSAVELYEIIEKREYSRYHLPLNLNVNKKKDNSDKQYDISLGGTCFFSLNIFKENDFLLFHFSGIKGSPYEGIKFSILGRIIWLQKFNYKMTKYGAEFKFYDDPFSSQQQSSLSSIIANANP